MNIGSICTRDVLVFGPQEPLANVAREMFARDVGSAVVVDARDGITRPVGIATDRDLLRGQFDRKADLFCLDVEDVMTRDPLVLPEECDVADAVNLMGNRAVRRAPVVDQHGRLVGIVTFDDLLPALARQMTSVARLIGKQVERSSVPHI